MNESKRVKVSDGLPDKNELRFKACPACEFTKLSFSNHPFKRFYRCTRLGCLMSGPNADSEEEARQKWNNLPRREESK